MNPVKIGAPLAKDEGLAHPRHAKPVKESKSLGRYPAPARTSRPPKESKSLLARLMRTIVTEFNRRIRRRDDKNGKFTCISCRQEFPSYLMEAGHFERRGHERLRLHQMNVHGQCHHCNCDLSGNHAAYREALVEMYGEEQVQALEAMKGPGGRMTIDEAQEFLRNLLSGKMGI